MIDEERIPVLVAEGQCLERTRTVHATDLAVRAAEAALEGAAGLRDAISQVSVVNMLSPAPASVASVVARRLGIDAKVREVTTIGGNSPQWLVARAAAAIAHGTLEGSLVVGAEAQRSQRTGLRGAVDALEQDLHGDEAHLGPDPVVGDDRSGVGPAELAAGLIAPVHVYALFESAIAAREGRGFAEQRAVLGELMAPLTAVAAGHPVAWFPERRSPGELSTITPDNRLVAEPYPKRMCAVINVDQAAAVVVTSLAAARRAGVAGRAVFCVAGAEATDVWFPSARPDLGRSPAIAAAGRAALDAAGTGTDEVSAFDLYSCFPCALEMGLEAFGLDRNDPRGATVTGGLPYFGGPGNNYTLHAIATMAGRLRSTGGSGLVTGLGWYATKHAVGIYSSDPPQRGFRRGDTSSAQAAIDGAAREVAAVVDDTATVVAATVVSGPDGAPSAAPVVARLDDGRQVAAAAEPSELPSLAGCNLVGRRVQVSGDRPRYRVVG